MYASIVAMVLAMGGLALAAGPATKPAGYGEPTRCTLNPHASTKDRWLDLDTGKLYDWMEDVPRPGTGVPLEVCLRPIRGKGIDLMDDAGGIVLDCVVMPTNKMFWDVPPQPQQMAILREAMAGTFTFLRDEDTYYLFRTREGAIGVLHMIGRDYREQGPMPLNVEFRLLAREN